MVAVAEARGGDTRAERDGGHAAKPALAVRMELEQAVEAGADSWPRTGSPLAVPTPRASAVPACRGRRSMEGGTRVVNRAPARC